MKADAGDDNSGRLIEESPTTGRETDAPANRR